MGCSNANPTHANSAEIIVTLISELANHRDDLVCIAAGTPVEMEEMLAAYPKLRERFDRELKFER